MDQLHTKVDPQRQDDQADPSTENVNMPALAIHQHDMLQIAIIGCVHGELDNLYKACEEYTVSTKKQIDIVLCTGDFESIRNENDLQCMACPPKYRSMVDFHRYYSGEKIAPILTIFIHGNHEASNYLMELPYGGWVAPNIYYMGFANVLSFNGFTIGGISGIYKHHTSSLGRFESCPLTESSMRSLYHTRSLDHFMMQQYRAPMDIFMSHDWPHTAAKLGNVQQLVRIKPHFKDDIDKDELGSPLHSKLLSQLKPRYWFSSHMHVRYPALYYHNQDQTETTRFLALDKIIPGRFFMQVMSFPRQNDTPCSMNTSTSDDGLQQQQQQGLGLHYDPEWLHIIRQTQVVYTRSNTQFNETSASGRCKDPAPELLPGRLCACLTAPTANQQQKLFYSPTQIYRDSGNKPTHAHDAADISSEDGTQTKTTSTEAIISTTVPVQFWRTAPSHTASARSHKHQPRPPGFQLNRQTVEFCNNLRIFVPVFDGKIDWCSPRHALELIQDSQSQEQS